MQSDCATPSAARDEKLALMSRSSVSLLASCDKAIVNGLRVSVLDDNSPNSEQPVKEGIASSTERMKEMEFQMMHSNVKIEEDTRDFLTEEIAEPESSVRRGQRRRREDENDDDM